MGETQNGGDVAGEAYELFDQWEKWMEAHAGDEFGVLWEGMGLSERTKLYSMFYSWMAEQPGRF